ncbi:S-layer homology domain-containing protein [Aminipila sp.]|uniref:S-layer homology domain-containing protein n=1 Tax=Aminipila sp. TaxID=2060095 RepID=UPI002897722B|nr:S-layer homology domain-containing protein [Aminipila sp.]
MCDVNVRSKFLKKIIAVLLSCLIVFSLVPAPESFAGDNGINITIKTAGIEVEVTDSKGNAVSFDSTNTDEAGYLSNSYSLSAGEYTYSTQQGGGTFEVGSDNQEIILRQVLLPIETEQQFDVTISDEKGNAYSRGKIYADGSKPTVKRVPFLLPAYGSQVKYNYKFIPEDKETYWGSSGNLYVYPDKSPEMFGGLNLSDTQLDGFIIREKAKIKIEVPTGAELHLYHRTRLYRPLEEVTVSFENTTDSYDIYSCDAPLTYLHYEVSQSGKITKGEYFNVKDYLENPLKVTELQDDNKIQIKTESQKYYAANIALNGPNSKYLTMKVGDHFDIFASRSWQAVNSITGNYYIDPKFHFKVKQGDSVEVSDDGIIRGIKKGVSVIEISYDAVDWQGLVYDPIWQENMGIFIVNVDPDQSEHIESGIMLNEFDTIYYLESQNGQEKEDHATYTFKPSAASHISVRVQRPLSENWDSGWTEYKPDENGSYMVDLYKGRNIVEISAGNSVEYYVIKASGIGVNIQNADNPLKPVVVGSPISIKFTGLESPFPKLGAVYNPGYPNEDWVQYNWDGNQVESEHVQYTLRTDNEIRLTTDEEGKINLSNGKIHTSVIGDKITGHQSLTNRASKVSVYMGQDSDESFNGYLCTLPDISFDVLDNDQLEEQKKQEYAELEITDKGKKQFAHQIGHNIIINQAMAATTTMMDLSFICNAKNASGVDIKATYWTEKNPTKSSIEINNGEIINIKKLFTLDDIGYAEIVSTPKNPNDGYTQTYEIRGMCISNIMKSILNDYYGRKAYLADLQIAPVDNALDYKNTDGKLFPGSDKDDIGLGYNFLCTKREYVCTVPYSTEKIKLNVIQDKELMSIKDWGKKPYKHLNSNSQVDILMDEKSIDSSGPIQLTGPETLITVKSTRTRTAGTSEVKNGEITWKNEETDTQVYTVKVLRAEPPKFLNISIPDNMQIKVKDGDKFLKPNSKGLYEIEKGKTYNIIAMMDGYLSKTIPFEAQSDDNQTLEIKSSELEKAPEQTGTIMVQSMGYNSILRADTTISIDKPEDLALKKYVEYNYGGYTALHAIIDAFNTGISKVKFSCYKGILKPEITINDEGQGSNAGWVCEVNGKTCDPATTLVNAGDKVEFYYNPDYEGMMHAWFKDKTIMVKQGESTQVTILSTQAKNDGTKHLGVQDATIQVNGKTIDGAVTDKDGSITIPSNSIADPGEYTITAQKTVNGKNILTYCVALITVKKVDTVPEEGKVAVKFRLIGDAKHDGIDEHGKYVTWIATKKMTFTGKSVSVYDVFTKALDEAGLEYQGAEKNYVRKIQAPKAYGGYWLGEFNNGKNSGWMYTVNGSHPELGLKDCYVANGDVIVWHYVDDYKLETSFEGSKPTYPNRWLEAEDKNPPTDGTIIDMSKGNKEKTEEIKEHSAVVTVNITAKSDSEGKAAASVSSKEMTEALKKALEAVKNSSKELIPEVSIAVKADDKANAVVTTLPTSSAKDIVKEKGILSLTTPTGDIRFNQEALSALAAEASGSDIKLTIEKVDASSNPVTTTITELAGRPVFNLSAVSNGKEITDFKSGKVTFYLPYTLGANEKKENLRMVHISDKGVQEAVEGASYDEAKKAMKGETNHFSYYAVTYSNIEFTDVTSGKWFYDSVMYLANKGIVKGKTNTTFSPDGSVTRAEFAQILYNKSGAPQVTNSAIFTDVSDNAWYAKAVNWAAEKNISKGFNGKFNPNANISREDMAVMLKNYLENVEKKEIAKTAVKQEFSDKAKISPYAEGAIEIMQTGGIINGYKAVNGQYSFKPAGNATRAEATSMMASLFQKLEK